MEAEEIILVNEKDEPIGVMEKIEAHKKGLLHRAFSIFIFNRNGEMLLQQRALNKYHSAGLWSNACCSHPRPGEDLEEAAHRRLKEEMGFDTRLEKIFDFVYEVKFDNGLTEHEFDHVFAGIYDGPVHYHKEEVMDVRFSSIEMVRDSLENEPVKYTEWFRLAFPKLREILPTQFSSFQ